MADLADIAIDNQINEVARGVGNIEPIYSKSNITECIVCDEPIPEERMEAYPSTEHCVHCKEEEERSFANKGWR